MADNLPPLKGGNKYFNWSCWTQIYPAFANSVDPNQLASEEANWSGSALFAINYVNLFQQSRSSKSDWLKINSGHGILIYSAGQGLIKNKKSFQE